MYNAYFTCFAGCPVKFPLVQVIYRCPECNSLLDVQHDVNALQDTAASQWKDTFDQRWMKTKWPYGSGVWGKKEWVYPHISDESVVSFAEGGSNLFRAAAYGRSIGCEDLWVKQCGTSHTGSFKDLGMTVLVSAVQEMIRRGKSIRAIACASTGDTSAALAAYCAAAGIPSLVLLPKGKVSIAQLIQPLTNGATVLSLDTDFDGCMKIVQEITQQGDIYLANSMNSLRIEGQKTVAIEIVQQFDWEVPDWIVIPGGNLGNVYALGKGLMLMYDLGLIDRLPRLCVAQAEHANPLYQAYKKGFENFEPMTAKTTAASAIQIGNPVSIHRAIRVLKKTDGVVEQASEHELADSVARADKTGMYNCPHTGVALAATEKLIKSGHIQSSDKVVVVSTAHGLKFTEFKRSYHESSLAGAESHHSNTPIEVPNDLDEVRRAIDKHT